MSPLCLRACRAERPRLDRPAFQIGLEPSCFHYPSQAFLLGGQSLPLTVVSR